MTIYRECTYEKTGTITVRATGVPVDITTWEFDAVLRNAAGESLLEMSTAEGHFIVTSGTDGEFAIRLTEDETEALAAGPVSFALYRIDDGRVRLGLAKDLVVERD